MEDCCCSLEIGVRAEEWEAHAATPSVLCKGWRMGSPCCYTVCVTIAAIWTLHQWLTIVKLVHRIKSRPSFQQSLHSKGSLLCVMLICTYVTVRMKKKRLICTLTLSLELELSLSSQAVCSYMGEACRCGPWACMTKYGHCDPLRRCAEQTPSPHSGEEQELVCLVRTQKVHKYSPNM